ncbi:MAG: DNA alkylation repair protein [bacterium]|nr:DNA alkylation repair protein [bacterium]
MTYREIIATLKSLSNTKSIDHMVKFGITPEKTYGVSIPHLRTIAKTVGRNHALALQLWEQDNRETRILAAMLAEPSKVTPQLIESWTLCFSYWEICDQCVMNLFEKTPLAWEIAVEYAGRPEEFIKRTGFVIIARLAVSDKRAGDDVFLPFFPLIVNGSTDERNMVKKAVNWALRQIGKRNLLLNQKAVEIAREVRQIDSPAARWIAADALKELQSDAVHQRLLKKLAKKTSF